MPDRWGRPTASELFSQSFLQTFMAAQQRQQREQAEADTIRMKQAGLQLDLYGKWLQDPNSVSVMSPESLQTIYDPDLGTHLGKPHNTAKAGPIQMPSFVATPAQTAKIDKETADAKKAAAEAAAVGAKSSASTQAWAKYLTSHSEDDLYTALQIEAGSPGNESQKTAAYTPGAVLRTKVEQATVGTTPYRQSLSDTLTGEYTKNGQWAPPYARQVADYVAGLRQDWPKGLPPSLDAQKQALDRQKYQLSLSQAAVQKAEATKTIAQALGGDIKAAQAFIANGTLPPGAMFKADEKAALEKAKAQTELLQARINALKSAGEGQGTTGYALTIDAIFDQVNTAAGRGEIPTGMSGVDYAKMLASSAGVPWPFEDTPAPGAATNLKPGYTLQGGKVTAAPGATAPAAKPPATDLIPANVKAALQGVGPGRHTLSDGSVWIKLPDGTIQKGS